LFVSLHDFLKTVLRMIQGLVVIDGLEDVLDRFDGVQQPGVGSFGGALEQGARVDSRFPVRD